MDVSIQDAAAADVDSVFDLICELENSTFPEATFREIFHRNLNDPRICYRIAYADNQVAGFGSAHLQTLLHHCGNVSEIQELIVKKKFQNRQIGKSLLESLIEWSFENGALHCEVTCNTKRTLAKEFYLKNHFIHSHHKLVYYK